MEYGIWNMVALEYVIAQGNELQQLTMQTEL